ncbi:MAG: VOC family protein [Paracoccaceae bacterium]
MAEALVEHVNITVSDPQATARQLCALFGWHLRWSGPSIGGGTTVHVGGKATYLALYSAGGRDAGPKDRYATPGALNHIGLIVEDLDATEARVRAAGYRPHNHASYEPGRRFYFDGPDGIEFELVSYV